MIHRLKVGRTGGSRASQPSSHVTSLVCGSSLHTGHTPAHGAAVSCGGAKLTFTITCGSSDDALFGITLKCWERTSAPSRRRKAVWVLWCHRQRWTSTQTPCVPTTHPHPSSRNSDPRASSKKRCGSTLVTTPTPSTARVPRFPTHTTTLCVHLKGGGRSPSNTRRTQTQDHTCHKKERKQRKKERKKKIQKKLKLVFDFGFGVFGKKKYKQMGKKNNKKRNKSTGKRNVIWDERLS
eukprot:PhF_6_TR3480/c0_g1_i1/m.5111